MLGSPLAYDPPRTRTESKMMQGATWERTSSPYVFQRTKAEEADHEDARGAGRAVGVQDIKNHGSSPAYLGSAS
jgi:hypothetical protein